MNEDTREEILRYLNEILDSIGGNEEKKDVLIILLDIAQMMGNDSLDVSFDDIQFNVDIESVIKADLDHQLKLFFDRDKSAGMWDLKHLTVLFARLILNRERQNREELEND